MAIHFLLLRKLMRNEPSILFSMKQTMFFVPKEQLGALSSWNEVKTHFVTICSFNTFSLYLLTHDVRL